MEPCLEPSTALRHGNHARSRARNELVFRTLCIADHSEVVVGPDEAHSNHFCIRSPAKSGRYTHAQTGIRHFYFGSVNLGHHLQAHSSRCFCCIHTVFESLTHSDRHIRTHLAVRYKNFDCCWVCSNLNGYHIGTVTWWIACNPFGNQIHFDVHHNDFQIEQNSPQKPKGSARKSSSIKAFYNTFGTIL